MSFSLSQSYARLRGYHLTGLLPKSPKTLMVIGPAARIADILIADGLFKKAGIDVNFIFSKTSQSEAEGILLKLFNVHTSTPSEAALNKHNRDQESGKGYCHVISAEILASLGPEALTPLEPVAIIVAAIDRKKRRIKLHTAFVPSGNPQRDLVFITEALSSYPGY